MLDTHHAYVHYGVAISALPSDIRTPTIDVVHYVADRLGIADSRALQLAVESRPVERAQKILVVQFSSATIEAQNALLKLLEEPPATVCFHILVPSPELLLETVRSRVHVADRTFTRNDAGWQDLRALPLVDQLAEIATRSKAKETLWQQEILAAAVGDEQVPPATRMLIDGAMRSPGASRKMLLEELVLVVANHG